MGIKECTCDEDQMLYVSDESLNSTLKTSIALYGNQLEFERKLGGGSTYDGPAPVVSTVHTCMNLTLTTEAGTIIMSIYQMRNWKYQVKWSSLFKGVCQ